jgi:hypothetical protein
MHSREQEGPGSPETRRKGRDCGNLHRRPSLGENNMARCYISWPALPLLGPSAISVLLTAAVVCRLLGPHGHFVPFIVFFLFFLSFLKGEFSLANLVLILKRRDPVKSVRRLIDRVDVRAASGVARHSPSVSSPVIQW